MCLLWGAFHFCAVVRADCFSKAPGNQISVNVKHRPFQEAGLKAPEPTGEAFDLDYSSLEALLNEPEDDSEPEALAAPHDESGPPSPAPSPAAAAAVPTCNEPEVAHPSTGGLVRAKSTDDMDTLQFMIDTQAGIDCAMELPLTQPMWQDFSDDTPPVLHRTSADMKNQDSSELANPEPAQLDPSELQDLKRQGFNDMLAHAALPKNTNILQQWDTIVIGDSDIENATSPARPPIQSKQEELATFSNLLFKMETKLGQLTKPTRAQSEVHALFGGPAGSTDSPGGPGH